MWRQAGLPTSSAQVPAEEGRGIRRAGTGREPDKRSEGPPGERQGRQEMGPAPHPPRPEVRKLLFLGRVQFFFFLTSLGNWKPWAPPRAIKRPEPPTKLKIKGPRAQRHWGWEGALCGSGWGGPALLLGDLKQVSALSGLWSPTAFD